MATFQMDFKQERKPGPPTESLGDPEVTAGLMEAIQNSIFKAIESMELAASNSSSNHYVTVVKTADSAAFKNELTGYLSLDPIPQVNEPSFINLIPSPVVTEEAPSSSSESSSSYSYEILTPVQIYWPPESSDSTDNLNMASVIQTTTTTIENPRDISTLTAVDNSNSNLSMAEGKEPDEFLVEDTTSTQSAHLMMEESSMDSEMSNPSEISKSSNGINGSSSSKYAAEKAHKCEICEKVFSQAYRLRTHISTVHLGTKPFKCEICSRAFARKSYLIQHGQVHAETKRYQCDLCHTAYARLADYKKHCRKPSHLEKVAKTNSKGESPSLSPPNLKLDEDAFVQENSDSME